MRIKRVVEADFRRSDLGVFERFFQKNRGFVESLNKDDVIVFVSKAGNQLLFIHGFSTVETAARDARLILPSVKYRIIRGSWNPLMLRNYAEAAGLSIDGLKLFEEHYQHLLGKAAA